MGTEAQTKSTASFNSRWTASAASLKKELENGRLDIPNGEEWRIPYLGKLLEQRQAAYYGGFEKEETRLTALIDSLCVN